jgi:hypothetical protein
MLTRLARTRCASLWTGLHLRIIFGLLFRVCRHGSRSVRSASTRVGVQNPSRPISDRLAWSASSCCLLLPQVCKSSGSRASARLTSSRSVMVPLRRAWSIHGSCATLGEPIGAKMVTSCWMDRRPNRTLAESGPDTSTSHVSAGPAHTSPPAHDRATHPAGTSCSVCVVSNEAIFVDM